MNRIATSLGNVESVGEEGAAILACSQTMAAAVEAAAGVSNPFAPDQSGDVETLTILSAALSSELVQLDGDRGSPVDPDGWARVRDEITRGYVVASGIEGTVGALPTLGDAAQYLLEAIANAPKVIGQALHAATGVAGGALWDVIRPNLPVIVLVLVLFVLVSNPELLGVLGRAAGGLAKGVA